MNFSKKISQLENRFITFAHLKENIFFQIPSQIKKCVTFILSMKIIVMKIKPQQKRILTKTLEDFGEYY